ncbi:MAG TPA: response regulator transcription factor [Agriterribacter sp.]|nr:response regulator transcription factor [Agriterribacter sp.]
MTDDKSSVALCVMISIGIIEDIDDYRNLLKLLLEHTTDMKVVFAVSSVEEALIVLNNNPVTVCIIDIGLPGKSGIELVKWITGNQPDTLCMMCTAYDSDDKVFQSLEAGAHGYILKSATPAAIVEAVKELCNGGSPMSSEVARKVVGTFSQKKLPEISLSDREQQVLELLAKGLFYKEISSQLSISIETVKRHCFNIYQKLHVSNRTEALNKYFGK